jgi:hypothetical protein
LLIRALRQEGVDVHLARRAIRDPAGKRLACRQSSSPVDCEEIGETFRYACGAGAATRRQLQSKLNASGAVNRRVADSVEFRPKNVDTGRMTPTKGKHRHGHLCRLKHLCDFFVSIAPWRRKRIEGFLRGSSENRS